MASTTRYTHPVYGTVTIHWRSTWAGRLGGTNNCVTPTAHDIYVNAAAITQDTLAHEYGHILDARRLGWRYLPWIIWCRLAYGFEKSPAELRAGAFKDAHWQEFTALAEQ